MSATDNRDALLKEDFTKKKGIFTVTDDDHLGPCFSKETSAFLSSRLSCGHNLLKG